MVYFDNFQVQHVRGRIIEEDHYYVYELKIAALSSQKAGNSHEGLFDNNTFATTKNSLTRPAWAGMTTASETTIRRSAAFRHSAPDLQV